MKWSWKLGEIAGIGIFVHTTFFILIAWIAISYWSVHQSAMAVLQGILFIIALFGCVVLHELGHALAASDMESPPRTLPCCQSVAWLVWNACPRTQTRTIRRDCWTSCQCRDRRSDLHCIDNQWRILLGYRRFHRWRIVSQADVPGERRPGRVQHAARIPDGWRTCVTSNPGFADELRDGNPICSERRSIDGPVVWRDRA